MKLHVALVLFGSITICICSQSTSLVKDYLTYNNLNTVLLIPCRNEPTVDSIRNLRTLQEYGGWTNVRDIADESLTTDSDKFFVRLSNAHCVVVSLDCNETIEFLSKASDRKLFHYERNWLIFGSNLSRSYDILREQNINVDAEVTLAIPLESDRSYELYEVYNPSSKHGGRLNVTRCGQWSESTGFHITFKQTKTQRRQNFNGITFPAVVTLRKVPKDITFMEHLRSNDLGYVNNVSRFGYHIFSLIMDIHNFKIHIHVANIFAYFDSSGWHGAIDAVNRSEVEFCLTPLRWENDRYGLLEQTIHIYHVRVLFIFRHPKSVPSNAFLLPFKSTLWYAIIGLSLLSACIVRNIFSVENHKKVTNSTKVVSTNEDSFSNSLLMVFGFIVQQGYFGNLLLTSSRILAIAVLTFSLLIYQFYSSFIVGSLLIESPKNIKTMKQLINSELTLGMDEVPYVENIYSYSKGESTEESYKRIMSNQKKSIMSTRAGLDLLKKGGFAFNTDASYAYNILKDTLSDTEKCDLQQIEYTPKVPIGPNLPNKSQFRELIKISLHRITETGLLSYYKKIFLGTQPKCEISSVTVNPVDITHFSSALYILVMGIACSLIILTVEILGQKYSERKTSRRFFRLQKKNFVLKAFSED